MDVKQYHYPGPIQLGKTGAKFGIVLFLIIFITLLTKPYLKEAYSGFSYYLVLSTPILGVVGCVFYIGLFADIGMDDEGLFVEFIGKQLRVFWKDITDIKPFGPQFLNYWVITTDNKLTSFHRIYGLYSLKSVAPSFCIYKSTKGHEFLLMKVKEKAKLNRREK